MAEIKAFGKWGTEGIKVDDVGLVDYISIEAKFVPRTGARHAARGRFYKSKTFIIERLMNKLMTPGHKGKKHKSTSYNITGKSFQNYKIVKEALEIIEKKTGKNPIAVVVKAIENAAPREEIISIEYGGARYPKSVDCAPQRRVDIALRNITQGAFSKSFGTKRKITNSLAEEIVAAYSSSTASNAVSKKNELERQADSSR